MHYTKALITTLFFIFFLSSCELPDKPNFTIENKFELPLLKEKKFYFLGGSDAFIDTTKGKSDTLFTRGIDEVVFISFTDSVEIGNLDDAIPTIDIDPTTINSEVGAIEVDDFSSSFGSAIGAIESSPKSVDETNAEIGTFKPSFEGSGNASFLSITGVNAPVISTPIVGGSSTIIIDLNAGDFISAKIKSGGIALEFTNNLGFTISSITAKIISNSTLDPQYSGSSLNFNNVNHGEKATGTIAFSENEALKVDLQVEVILNWDAQNYIVNGANSLAVAASDDNLVVYEAEAELASQALVPNTPNITISDPGFVYAIISNSTNSNKNNLSLTLINNTSLPLTNSTFDNFATITLFNSDGEILDEPKTISPSNPTGNQLNPGETATVVFNLSGVKLTKVLSYTLDLGTLGSNGSSLVVKNSDALVVQATTSNLEIEIANAVIEDQTGIELSDEATIEGDFVKAEVENGSLNLVFRNSLNIPISINSLTIKNKNAFVAKKSGRYIAAGTEIGTLSDILIESNSTTFASVDLQGKAISDEIIFEALASSTGSNGATTSLTSSEKIDIDITGSISVSEAESKLKPQSFNSSDTLTIDKESFEFASSNHYVKLNSGQLVITQLINSLDVSLDTLIIKVPSIKNSVGNPLVINFYGDTRQGTTFKKIGRKESGNRAPVVVDLAGYSIFAPDNKIAYTVYGKTEDTRTTSEPTRVIKSSDKISATLSINSLKIGQALGKIVKKEIILGEDDPSNGTDILDILNSLETEVAENDGLKEISDKLTNLQLIGSELSINYESNIGVEATVYMAIAGKKSDGSFLFLKGKNEYAVTDSDNITKLYNGGVQIPKENLVKFTIGKNETTAINSYLSTISFNETNSNVDEFLSELPSEFRTIGIAVINPNNEASSFVANPILFKTELSIDIPLSINTTKGPLSVLEDLGDIDLFLNLPKQEDDFSIDEMTININYENKIPLGINVDFDFIDSLGNVLDVQYTPILLEASNIDENGFTTTPKIGKAELLIVNNEALNKTAKMNLILEVVTTSSKTVKIRYNDFIQIKLNAISTGSTTVK